jgi:hypothetical protein
MTLDPSEPLYQFIIIYDQCMTKEMSGMVTLQPSTPLGFK